MVYIHVRHRVEDYARWREGFDNHAPARQAGGATDEAYVMRNVDDPNEITITLGWSDLEKARAFTQSASLKEAMQKAGVTGPRRFVFGGCWLSRSCSNDDVLHQNSASVVLLVGTAYHQRVASPKAATSGRAMTTARCLDVWAMPGYSMALERRMIGRRALYDRVYVYA